MHKQVALLAGLAIATAGCGTNETPEPEGDSLACAIGAGAEISDVCTMERVSEGEFIIHHPDGGFRRFTSRDGIIAHDGADKGSPAKDGADDMLEISVDGDRYLIPNESSPKP